MSGNLWEGIKSYHDKTDKFRKKYTKNILCNKKKLISKQDLKDILDKINKDEDIQHFRQFIRRSFCCELFSY